jgi:hypothetical protein
VATTEERLAEMRRTPARVLAAIRDQPAAVLGRRPAPGEWSATEIVCHLRDVEEFYLDRVETILVNDEPALVVLDPDRWAAERQYARHDPLLAHEAFARRRQQTLGRLAGLAVEQWERAGVHRLRGRVTVRQIVHGWARHDLAHLEQLAGALKASG